MMEINGLNSTTLLNNTAQAANTYSASTETTKEESTTQTQPAGVYEPSEKSSDKYTVDRNQVNKLIEESNNQVESFRKLIEGLFKKQGEKWQKAQGKTLGEQMASLEVDEATRKKAQEDISEDGYYGVKQTSERLINFAKAITGGDPSKIEEMRKAIQKGFGAAEKEWGSKMPSITQQTYDATMKGLDEWAESAKKA